MARETQRNLAGIGPRIAAMVALILVLAPVLTREPTGVPHPEPPRVDTGAEPIAAEADVFRTAPSDLAVEPATQSVRVTAQRTLESFRSLRAYPGAPPRIPHALSEDEFRFTTCATCHVRGGFVSRFGTFAPVTPHPEYENCLQCHVPEQTSSTFRETDWRSVDWPAIGQRAMEGSPPWIPHDLAMRGNCLACHGGPAAVAEIRTTHPERANCRQCHVPIDSSASDDAFSRPVDAR